MLLFIFLAAAIRVCISSALTLVLGVAGLEVRVTRVGTCLGDGDGDDGVDFAVVWAAAAFLCSSGPLIAFFILEKIDML